MALMKMCKCGQLIPQGTKRCGQCEKKYQEHKKDNNKHYDTHIRDKKAISFYHSKEWLLTRENIKHRDNGLCKLCLNNKIIKPMDTVHHIEELKDSWSKRINNNNLISVCDKCHKLIHAKYNKSPLDKLEMQRELRRILIGEGEVENF